MDRQDAATDDVVDFPRLQELLFTPKKKKHPRIPAPKERRSDSALPQGTSHTAFFAPLSKQLTKRINRKSSFNWLRDTELYLNRELTWLSFNQRVLHEASDPRCPFLERLKFLSIVRSNLDEFFMKRIGGLKLQVTAGINTQTVDGRTPQQQINECLDVVAKIEDESQHVYEEIMAALFCHGIEIVSWKGLKKAERQKLNKFFRHDIFPLLTPQCVSPAHPFPFISNLSLNLLVSLRNPGANAASLGRVKVPIGSGISRFVPLDGGTRFIALEDVIEHNLGMLFRDETIESCAMFRVIRNANTEKDEEQAEDLLTLIESELNDRKMAPIVRVEISRSMSKKNQGMLAAELGLDETQDVMASGTILGMRDLMEIATLDVPSLRDPAHLPVCHPELEKKRNIFHAIRDAGSILLHHPYHSFSSSVGRLLAEASSDPKVRAIKMTLYRTSESSRVVESLIAAARNGKQVSVVMELKARFDEDANIRRASRLEEAGINVTYGMVGLKTHCKVIFIVRQDYSGLRCYAHIGTGNYHADTARRYSDLGMLTCDEHICNDVTELFNYLTTGKRPQRPYGKILTAPKILKLKLLKKIDAEIAHAAAGRDGLIRFKCNALEDPDIVAALYRASMAGVQVSLIIRDTCRLRPGLANVSENVQVVSVVGRFLEHARIYHFGNGGNDEYYIGSADLMHRNLEHRIEVLAPIEKPALKNELDAIMSIQLADSRSAWDLQPGGAYIQRKPKKGLTEPSSQEQLIDRTQRQLNIPHGARWCRQARPIPRAQTRNNAWG